MQETVPPIVSPVGQWKTLEQFIIEQEQSLPHSTGAFSRLIRDISLAAKIVNREINKAGLVDLGGSSGVVNVQGETQQKLDAMAHNELVRALRRGGECCLIGSEEYADPIVLDTPNGESGEYMVLFDPLDGSSNIEVNVSVGTIFSIYHLPPGIPPSLEAALRPGTEQVAAGYVIYGSSTMFVYTTGRGVNGFTLDQSIGEFFLSHPDIRIPDTGRIYSINEGYYHAFEPGLRRYIKWMQEEDASTGRPYTTRYIGSYISDFHRNLLKGGIFIYPLTAKNPGGKLRLMYEVNPTAFIVEQAGGLATDGYDRVMERVPRSLHERCPLYIGSREMVERARMFLEGG
ncbi:MAG: class 1 fructose-bisphosphatase [Rhodothermales bacterium]